MSVRIHGVKQNAATATIAEHVEDDLFRSTPDAPEWKGQGDGDVSRVRRFAAVSNAQKRIIISAVRPDEYVGASRRRVSQQGARCRFVEAVDNHEKTLRSATG